MVNDTLKVYRDAMRTIVSGYCSECKIPGLSVDAQSVSHASAIKKDGWRSSSATKFFGLVMFLLLIYIIAIAVTRNNDNDTPNE